MNDKWKVKFGREHFYNFIMRILASQVHNGFHDWDRPWPPTRTVTGEAMLGRFLTARPEFKPFGTEIGAELARSFAGLTEFCVNAILSDKVGSA
jgi:hypothetical protein